MGKVLQKENNEQEKQSKQIVAYNYLLNSITTGKFPPEKPLIEREICDTLNISRTPVREAMRQLSSEGLVDFIPNRGVFVSQLTKEKAAHMYELKEALEGMAAKLFAERGSAAYLKKLEDNLAEHIDLVKNKEMDQAVEADMKFHVLLVEGAESPMLEQQAKRLFTQTRRLSKLAIYDYDKDMAFVFIKQHQAIFDAIRSRDGAAACAAVSDHIRFIENFQFERWSRLF